jgi:AcrR family transcriptional regulator
MALLSRADSPQEPKRLAGELGVGYRTAWRMRRALLRALDETGPDAELLRAIAVAWAPPAAAECPELAESPGPADPPRSQATTPRVDAICEAACRVLAARGLERTRISDIAAEARVSSAVIHYYFESKDQLLLAALEWTDQRALESYRELQHITDDATTRLRKLVAVTAPSDDVSRNDWLLWLETGPLARRPALFPTVQRIALRYFTAVNDVIERGCRSGEFRPVASVDEVCLRFISYADGLATRCLLGYEDFAPEKVAELLGRFAEEQLGLPAGALQSPAVA